MRVTIEKIENGYVVSVPARDDKGNFISYEFLDYAYSTLDKAIEKVKEVYGS